MEGYGWIVMMLTFMVNFLLILGTNRLCGHPPGGIRAAIAAFLGALHALWCMLPGFAFLSNGVWRLIFLVLTALTAFGMHRSTIRPGFLFCLLRLSLEGITGGGAWAVILAAVVIFLLCMAGRKEGRQQYVPITISHGGKEVSLMALLDTGNTLKDPITGASVLVVDGDVARKLLALDHQQLSHPIETLATLHIPGLRLIPYCAVGQSAGLLLGLKVERLYIDGKLSDSVVAFAPQRIGQGTCFRALAGGTV